MANLAECGKTRLPTWKRHLSVGLAAAGLLLGISAAAPQAGAQTETPPEVKVGLGLVKVGQSSDWANIYPFGRVETWDFQCGNVATFLLRYEETTLNGTNTTPRTISLDLELDAYTQGEPGAGFTSFVGSPTVLGAKAGETAALVDRGLSGPAYTDGSFLKGSITLTGLGPGADVIIVEQKARITCVESNHNPQNNQPPPAFSGLLYSYLRNVKDVTTTGPDAGGANATGFNRIEIRIADPESKVEFEVTKNGPPTATAGSTVAYTVTIRNTDIVDLFVEDVFDFVNDLQATLVADDCSEITVPAGTSVDCVIRVRFTGTATDMVQVVGGGNRRTSNEVTTLLASMKIAKSVKNPPAVVTVGTVLTFEIVVTNDGDAALTGIVVNDPLAPASCPATTLAAGATMTCTVTYAVTAANQTAGSVVNVATADSAQTDPVTSSTVTVTVAAPTTTLPTAPNPTTPTPTTPTTPTTGTPSPRATTATTFAPTPTSVIVRTSTAQLPVTGSTDVEPYLWSVAALFSAGAAYVVGSRRRKAL